MGRSDRPLVSCLGAQDLQRSLEVAAHEHLAAAQLVSNVGLGSTFEVVGVNDVSFEAW
jgi:hypothetical protein